MVAYYNDNDLYVAAWLRNLIAAGHIDAGDVDERSIADVQPGDLKGYAQCHFFAGIGGWPLALRLARWHDTRSVWTGSCPCQPFSGAGTRKAGTDSRHLWPVWFRLVRICRPERIFGEQVEGASGLGWWDRVSADLEAQGYTVGAAVLGAHSVGAPHIRQRIFFVADHDRKGRRQHGLEACAYSDTSPGNDADRSGEVDRVGDTDDARSQGRRVGGHGTDQCSAWSPSVAVACSDGRARRVEPGLQPLAHGVSARVGRLRAYGNAVVPQVAAAFIAAALEVRP